MLNVTLAVSCLWLAMLDRQKNHWNISGSLEDNITIPIIISRAICIVTTIKLYVAFEIVWSDPAFLRIFPRILPAQLEYTLPEVHIEYKNYHVVAKSFKVFEHLYLLIYWSLSSKSININAQRL